MTALLDPLASRLARQGAPLAAMAVALPVLLTQGLRVKRSVLRLPDAGGLTGQVGGAGEPLHIVVLGDSVAAAVGLDHHEDSIAGHLARLLATRHGRPVGWEVLGLTGATAADVRALARPDALAPADVVVISVGVNDTKNLHPDRRWRAELAALLDTVVRLAPQADVVLLGLPPMQVFPALPRPLADLLGARARRIDAIGARVAAGFPRVTRVVLDLVPGPDQFAEDGFHPSSVVHEHLARAVAAALSPRS